MSHFPSSFAPTSMFKDGDRIFPIMLLLGRSSTLFEATIFPFTSPSQITVSASMSALISPVLLMTRVPLVLIWPSNFPSMHKVPPKLNSPLNEASLPKKVSSKDSLLFEDMFFWLNKLIRGKVSKSSPAFYTTWDIAQHYSNFWNNMILGLYINWISKKQRTSDSQLVLCFIW